MTRVSPTVCQTGDQLVTFHPIAWLVHPQELSHVEAAHEGSSVWTWWTYWHALFCVGDVYWRAVPVRDFSGDEDFLIRCAEFFQVGDFLRGKLSFDFAVQAVPSFELLDDLIGDC